MPRFEIFDFNKRKMQLYNSSLIWAADTWWCSYEQVEQEHIRKIRMKRRAKN